MKSKINILLGVLILFTGVSAFAQTPLIHWEKTFGGYNDGWAEETAMKVRPGIDGGYITCGYTITTDIPDGLGEYDGWVVKYDDEGNVEWKKSYGGTSYDMLLGIERSADGLHYILSGWTMSSDGDADDGDHSSGKIWVLEIDTDGTVLWHKCYGGSGYDGPLYPYIADAYNQVIIKPVATGGYILSSPVTSADGDITFNNGNNDIWVARLDETGAILWENSYGGSGDDYPSGDIYNTADGGFVIGGSTNSNDGDVTGNHGGYDFWLIQIDSIGNLQWQKTYGGSESDLATGGVCPAGDGAYLLAGTAASTDGDVSALGGGTEDWWIVKVDNEGTIQWNKAFGNTGTFAYDYLQVAKPAINGGYLLAGLVAGNGAAGTGIGDLASLDGPMYGYNDGWIMKLDNDGNVLWEENYGTEHNESFLDVFQSEDGSLIAAGHQDNTLDSAVSSAYLTQNWWTVKFYACPAYAYIHDTICKGQSYDFSGHLYTEAGIYTDTLVMSTTGCDSFVQLTLVLDTLSTPAITASDNILETGVYSSYVWLKDGVVIPGAEGQSYTASENGNYTVVVTNERGCTDTSEVYSYIPDNINEPASFRNMGIYPNPATEQLTIEIPGLKSEAYIKLSTIEGRLIFLKRLQNTISTIDISELSSGVYFMEITMEEGKVVRKIVKK